MSDEQSSSKGLGNQFYEEAADWFSKMRGPDADEHQAAFDAWLKRGALHRAAYNRIAEIFLDSDGVSRARTEPKEGEIRVGIGRTLGALILVAILAIAISLWFLIFNGFADPAKNRTGTQVALAQAAMTLSTSVGEIRVFKLSDGSQVTLDTDSLLTADYSAGERRLRLIRGRARFEVAHEARPFKVAAGSGLVIARGTIFDVRLRDRGHVSVLLLRGVVDVMLASRSRQPVRRLMPGEATAYSRDFADRLPQKDEADQTWPRGSIEFHDKEISYLIEEANRYALTPIVVDAPEINRLRVSGIFSMKDPPRLARQLAGIFGLDYVIEPDRILLTMKRHE